MRPLFIVLGAAALIGLLTSCATSPAKRTEKLLTQSGFKVVPATTPAQQQQLSRLSPDKISPVKRNGKVYYVFPDHIRNVAYVGNKAQYHAYQIAVQNQQLSEDARLERDVRAAPMENEDAAVMSGAEPGWEQIWEGWPTGE
jgi:hypothetical protein